MYAQIPTIGFLYIAGYIGHTGRKYLIETKKGGKAVDKEIIIVRPIMLCVRGGGLC